MRSLNIVVWGMGPHAIKNILPVFKNKSNLNLYGILSRDSMLVSQLSQEYNCVPFSCEDQMLSDKNIDIVYVATPTGLHYIQGIKVIGSNKHFWSEKPIVQNAQQAYSLISLANQKNLTVAEGFMYLYHPSFKFLKDSLNKGQLGKINNITIDFGLPKLIRPGFRSDSNLGGGAIFDLGTYSISTIIELFGNEIIDIIYCELNYEINSQIDTSAIVLLKVNKNINVILRWAYNVAYKNEINIWGDVSSVTNKRFFSKPINHTPEFNFTNLKGESFLEITNQSNHFENMFNEFYGYIYNTLDSREHQEKILKRANLLDSLLEININKPDGL